MAIDVYLHIDGIKGESADSTHPGWIELTSHQPTGASSNREARPPPLAAAIRRSAANIGLWPSRNSPTWPRPSMLSLLFFSEREWQAIVRRKFGIGNISLADGTVYRKHQSHKDGLQVDVRALRRDGAHAGVSIYQRDLYDKDATARLIGIFRSHPSVRSILFNDSQIPTVTTWEGQDDHFHVSIRAATT